MHIIHLSGVRISLIKGSTDVLTPTFSSEAPDINKDSVVWTLLYEDIEDDSS